MDPDGHRWKGMRPYPLARRPVGARVSQAAPPERGDEEGGGHPLPALSAPGPPRGRLATFLAGGEGVSPPCSWDPCSWDPDVGAPVGMLCGGCRGQGPSAPGPRAHTWPWLGVPRGSAHC